ncbi:MAG: FGGY family carbohydrate kinase, partial [Christensenella sp.]
MADELILAHDLGTSSDKACLFDVHGNFLAEAYHQYPVYYPEQGWAEQNPRDWWDAVKVTSREVMKKADVEACDVKAISFSAHGMGVIPVDKSGELLCERTMVWMDARSTKEAKQILEQTGIREHYDKTGNSFDMALYPAAKILWIKRNMPDVYKKTYKFLGTKEYLIHKMTGVISHTDYTEVGLSGFYNLHTHEFDEELLRASEVDEHKLPEVADVTKVMGELTAAAAAEMGLAAGTPVVLGSWDNFACATGGGGRTKGNMVAYLGTAGWLGATHNQPLMSEDFMSNVVYVGEGTYFTTAHSNSACASYEWVIDNACGYLRESENPYAEADRLAAEVCAGSDNLFFLPSFFSGNTFYSDASLRGGFLGISAGHTNGHIIRAAMEGV